MTREDARDVVDHELICEALGVKRAELAEGLQRLRTAVREMAARAREDVFELESVAKELERLEQLTYEAPVLEEPLSQEVCA